MFLLAAVTALPDILLADFEGYTYGGWSVEGTAFGSAPSRGTLPNQMPVSGYRGKGLVNSYQGGDASTGSLTSPGFLVSRRWLTFLIGGGYDPENLAFQLLVDGKVVRSATGTNRKPGGSEALHPENWDLADLQGKAARLRILDQATGGWGHINVDHIVQTDKRPPMMLQNASRTLELTDRFLLIPVKQGAPSKRVTFEIEGLGPVVNDVELSDETPDSHAALEVSQWKGKRVTITVDRLAEDSRGLKDIRVSAQIGNQRDLYNEALRGQFHFSPRRGWTNDPNGLVYYKGEYHLFFQHNPYGWGWGNMHWGHAVSRDLVHWKELPIALFPDPAGTMFSGSAVVDWKNDSGLGQGGEPPVLLFYTAAGSPFTQGLAYSQDGRQFTKWSGNPIVGHLETGDRDPKVFWHEPTQRWVMALYLEIPGKPTLQILTSTNLKTWTPASRIEGYHECPDLFELPVRGLEGVKKWVITGANSNYQVGSFDGRIFRPETDIIQGHTGRGFYAAQTFSDVSERRIQIGWFQTESMGMPFNQSMSLPMELGLVQTASGPRLTWTPVSELKGLREVSRELGEFRLQPKSINPLKDEEGELLELEADVQASSGSVFPLTVRGLEIVFDATDRIVKVGDHSLSAPWLDKRFSFRLFCDRNGYEIFFNDGQVFLPWPSPPKRADRKVSLHVKKGEAVVKDLTLHHLKSAWQRQ